MSEDKPASIDAFIARYPAEVQALLQSMRQTIREAAPGAVETIAYGIPTFKLHGRNLVHFAAYQGHIGFYPNPGGIEAFSERLAGYKQSKGTIKFPLDEPLPLDLIAEITAFRAAQIEAAA